MPGDRELEAEMKMSAVIGLTTYSKEPIEERRIAEIPPSLEKEYNKTLNPVSSSELAARYGMLKIFDAGNPDCLHPRIFFIDNAFDGQAWWCDECPRHEKLEYSPGLKMPFPSDTLISASDPEHGEKKFYGWKTDKFGKAHELPREEWVPRLK